MISVNSSRTSMFNIVSDMKNSLLRTLGLIEFNKHGDEYQQAILRMAIIGLTIIFMNFSYADIRFETSFLMYCFAASSFSIVIHTRLQSTINQKRLLLVMFLDVLGASLSVYFTNDIGAVFIGVYLWLIIGYGFRFGRKLLIATYITSLTGFMVASLSSPYWQTHLTAFYGLLFTLVSVPLYALALLTKLKEATYKAEAASRAKSEFLSHISHEIRTPLNGIVGACSLLERSNLDQSNATLFNVMKNSSNVLLELVNNVLDLSKIESGKSVIHQENFYLENLILTTNNLFETQAKEKGIAIDYEISKDSPSKLHGNLLHIKQVLINLVGNAVKFTEQGTVKVAVSATQVSESTAKVRFEVIDSGIGIGENSLPHIFESFTQAEESIKYKFGGTGLGTTISKQLVEMMGGEIGIESELGRGSTFWFELPLDIVADDLAEGNVSSEIIQFKKAHNAAKKKSFRILVAEDNETNILILTEMLKLGNHQFDIVKNGQLALDMLEEYTYDMMILDCNMPEMGGLEALRIYQAINVGLPQIPAIILSADATSNTVAEFESLGVAKYLAKPIQLEALNQAVEEVGLQSKYKPNEKLGTVLSFNEMQGVNISNDQTQALSLVDIARLDELAVIGNSPTFIQGLITGFLEDTDQNLITLKQHVKALDFQNIQDYSHAIAGSATNIGAAEFSVLCEELNRLTPVEVYKIASLMTKIANSYDQTRIELLAYLEYQSGIRQAANIQ